MSQNIRKTLTFHFFYIIFNYKWIVYFFNFNFIYLELVETLRPEKKTFEKSLSAVIGKNAKEQFATRYNGKI